MPPAPIQAVLFDAYGTLFDVYSVRVVADDLFPGHGARLAELWRDKQMDYSRLRALAGAYVDFWTVTGDALDVSCERLDLPLSAAARKRLMAQYARLTAFPENLGVLTRLKTRGLPLGVLSNGSPAMLASAVSAAGMDGVFDRVLSVDAVRTFKPHPATYGMGPDALGLGAGEILFVSSNGWDACCAALYGYQAFWVNRAGLPAERLGAELAGAGRTLADVESFIAGA